MFFGLVVEKVAYDVIEQHLYLFLSELEAAKYTIKHFDEGHGDCASKNPNIWLYCYDLAKPLNRRREARYSSFRDIPGERDQGDEQDARENDQPW